jgi:hypothetical protein
LPVIPSWLSETINTAVPFFHHEALSTFRISFQENELDLQNRHEVKDNSGAGLDASVTHRFGLLSAAEETVVEATRNCDEVCRSFCMFTADRLSLGGSASVCPIRTPRPGQFLAAHTSISISAFSDNESKDELICTHKITNCRKVSHTAQMKFLKRSIGKCSES